MSEKSFLRFIALTLLVLAAYFAFHDSSWRYRTIHSDGRGYYAFLPALLVFQDKDYQKTTAAEAEAFQFWDSQNYINIDKNGRKYNKCFPGVSVLQAPFFIAGLGVSALTNQKTTGYSNISLVFVIIAGLVFAFLGIWLFYLNMKHYTKNKTISQWVVICLLFGTFLFFYLLAAPSYSHVYSFFLLNLAVFQIHKIIQQQNLSAFLFLGVTIGLIFIVRPTNIIIVLLLPFLCGDLSTLKNVFYLLFKYKAIPFLLGTLGFLALFSILPLLWYWQTGKWLVWSYHGEGFNFLNPKIWTTLFSYRIGIFVQTPMLFIALFGLLYLYKKSRWHFFCWIAYFSVLLYIIASWWSYDYGSALGHRAFSEHLFIFGYPLAALFKSMKQSKTLWILIALLVAYTFMRTYQHTSGIFVAQRFTQATFWKSIFDFKKTDYPKYAWLKDCELHAKAIKDYSLQTQATFFTMNNSLEFKNLTTIEFPTSERGERYMLDIRFKKLLHKPTENWCDILLVAAGENTTTGVNYYQVLPIFNYYKEGASNWHSTHILWDLYYDFKPVPKINLYIWNKKKKSFAIKEIELNLLHAQ